MEPQVCEMYLYRRTQYLYKKLQSYFKNFEYLWYVLFLLTDILLCAHTVQRVMRLF